MNNELNLNELKNATGGADSAHNVTLHLVQPGDTLNKIAGMYGTTAEAIFNLNKASIITEAKKHGLNFANERDYMNYIYPNMVLSVK